MSDHIGSLFRETKVHYKRGNINFQLGKTTYDMTLSAYARENNFDHAEAILWEMVDDFLDGNINAKPDLREYHFIVLL